MKSSLLVFVGAGLGGLMRHVLNNTITALAGSHFPFGILAINVIGSTAMGLVAGFLAFRGGEGAADLRLFLATGILGGFTTFSAFSLDAALLIERGETLQASAYVVGSVAFSLLGLFIGLWTMRALAG
jgi:CrcB protein